METKDFLLKNIIVHQEYGTVQEEWLLEMHDIALLELAEEVDLSVYTPVCLPSSVRNRDNTPALAIGKGRVYLIVLNSTLWFLEIPQEPPLRNDRRSNPGWGRTAGWIERESKETVCNSTG